MSRLIALIAVVCGLVLAPGALAAGPAKGPHHETATRGGVTATLRYRTVSPYQAAGVRLTIVRDGVTALARDPVEAGCKGCRGAMPVGGLGGSRASSLTLRDLSGAGEPDVLVDLYTGGAHCCSVTVLYHWDAGRGAYRRIVHPWGDPGYRIVDLRHDGRRELLSADDRFAYAFCAYVCSAMPVQIWQLRAGRLVDVTRRFPAEVRRDARRLQRMVHKARGHNRYAFALKGILPALCADDHLLGRGAACRRTLDTALRRGQLGHADLDIAPGGRKYVRAVLRFLKKTGYR